MNTEKFSDSLGNIEEKYIDEAAGYTDKTNVWIKRIAVAACLALIAFGGIFGILSGNGRADPVSSYFIITANAANGEKTDLSPNESCFNSATRDGNLFGGDIPQFSFSVRPSDYSENKALYDKFNITVSYDGHTVAGKDEHIIIGYLVPQKGAPVGWSYLIIGWFEDTADIVVTITEKESGATVENITVNVTYLPERLGYELKITDMSCVYAEK